MKQLVWNDLDSAARESCLARPVRAQDDSLRDTVREIVATVRGKGDEALRDYTQRFDKVRLNDLTVSAGEREGAERAISSGAKAAIECAWKNIRSFHEKEEFSAFSVETMPGALCHRIVRPVERAGLYVPGGTAPLISTTLMLGVPAQIAGCPEKILCTPCDREGRIDPHILYAARLCGIEKIFRVGGAQAIAAMAYGTPSVPKTDKIFGPGNAYVTAAKTLVAQDPEGAAIDLPAGPSEVCVIADETTNPAFAAADLLAQAEHDTLSQVLLIALSPEKARAIHAQIEIQLSALPRRDIAAQALGKSLTLIARDPDEALAIANRYAPEHLILCFEGAEIYLDRVRNAGSVFIGPWTPESAGDYASGTNHVLPTYGHARAYSGLGVEAFQKTITVQSLTREGLKNLGPAVQTLAGLEGLDAHARAVSIRLESGEKS